MNFILETPAEEKHPTFNCVKANQFFVNLYGELCQKIGCSSYNVVALKDGTPFADYYSDLHDDFVIERILPKVVKIEF